MGRVPFPALMIVHHPADAADRPIAVVRVADTVDALARAVPQLDGMALERTGGCREDIRHTRIFRRKGRRVRRDNQVTAARERGVRREHEAYAPRELPA